MKLNLNVFSRVNKSFYTLMVLIFLSNFFYQGTELAMARLKSKKLSQTRVSHYCFYLRITAQTLLPLKIHSESRFSHLQTHQVWYNQGFIYRSWNLLILECVLVLSMIETHPHSGVIDAFTISRNNILKLSKFCSCI